MSPLSKRFRAQRGAASLKPIQRQAQRLVGVRFRAQRGAASLKLGEGVIGCVADERMFPRPTRRGLIEAATKSRARCALVMSFPRPTRRGLIEARPKMELTYVVESVSAPNAARPH